MKLKLFSFFHLNLAYSAIETHQYKTVIDKCYWPLLRIAKRRQLPFGFEVSAWTLETIAKIDPEWIETLRDLVANGPCEFIGCGYAQVIGPLVPAAVNEANFRLGMLRYEELLGLRPKIALLNEQAYAAGLVPLYREAGYEALIMEWNNPAREHPEWDEEWSYLPQFAKDCDGGALPLIWNKSISFQKFQRYVHGEIELDEYLDYVHSYTSSSIRAFPLYGNDVEVFDFRPGRYMTEAPLSADGEWKRIDTLYAAIQQSDDLECIAVSNVLNLMNIAGAGNYLQLESAAQPVPVKKQSKYNLLRWAVSGRDDLGINTRCWKIYDALQASDKDEDADWMELCYLWSSDFRTHITELRWQEYLERLKTFEARWVCTDQALVSFGLLPAVSPNKDNGITIKRAGRFIEFKGHRFNLRLNCLRGLALESLIDATISSSPLCGTLEHGYYDDIQWGADYFSGHLIFESPGRHKITDLILVEPMVTWVEGGVVVSATIQTTLGVIEKSWLIDEAAGRVVLSYKLHWKDIGLGSLRLGHITLNPEVFEESSLAFSSHNGGNDSDKFPLIGTDFDHGRPVSFLISANHTVGMTEGVVEIGDKNCSLRIEVNKAQAATVGLVTHRKVRDMYFCRLALSVKELDDTCREGDGWPIAIEMEISCQ